MKTTCNSSDESLRALASDVCHLRGACAVQAFPDMLKRISPAHASMWLHGPHRSESFQQRATNGQLVLTPRHILYLPYRDVMSQLVIAVGGQIISFSMP